MGRLHQAAVHARAQRQMAPPGPMPDWGTSSKTGLHRFCLIDTQGSF
ncbi:MAG: hypothetical protein V2J65_15830 [Desulfobacteraceae bacterium]|nr:hypothetical protein [Desulfobacteraceae bacterium]